MKPIAIWYHCLFMLGEPPKLLKRACEIINEQMDALDESGLLNAATEFHVGINGGPESVWPSRMLFPKKAKCVFHGLQCRNECRTIRMIEEWLPGHEDWYVFYFHAKGSTSKPEERGLNDNWRACMQRNLITNWRQCVQDLDEGYDVVGCHHMSGEQTPPGQSIFAGNFWHAKASYLQTLPSIMERDRIKLSGIDSLESRYESEVYLFNGQQKPKVKDYHHAWIDTCTP